MYLWTALFVIYSISLKVQLGNRKWLIGRCVGWFVRAFWSRPHMRFFFARLLRGNTEQGPGKSGGILNSGTDNVNIPGDNRAKKYVVYKDLYGVTRCMCRNSASLWYKWLVCRRNKFVVYNFRDQLIWFRGGAKPSIHVSTVSTSFSLNVHFQLLKG